MSKTILVLGATGKQGRSVIKALLSYPEAASRSCTIYAATRDPTSTSAQRLSALSPSIKPVLGDLKSMPAAIKALPTKVSAIFIMSYPGRTEEADGIATVDAAVTAGAQHIVFTSVDRGPGSPATEVPHFKTKHNIEQHLKAVCDGSNGRVTYTIIRPPYFLDNLNPGFLGKVFATLWKTQVKRPLAVIDTSDIGTLAGAAIMSADSPSSMHRNRAFEIAGDKLTFVEANQVFHQKAGKDIPTTYGFVVSLLLLLSHDVREMTKFFNEPGFAADVEDSKRRQKMTSFGDWVDRSPYVSNVV